MSEPMVRLLEVRCPNCGPCPEVASAVNGWELVALPTLWPAADAHRGFDCDACDANCLVAADPVPGMDDPIPATEPDLDSRDEYEYEDAPLLQEDRR